MSYNVTICDGARPLVELVFQNARAKKNSKDKITPLGLVILLLICLDIFPQDKNKVAKTYSNVARPVLAARAGITENALVQQLNQLRARGYLEPARRGVRRTHLIPVLTTPDDYKATAPVDMGKPLVTIACDLFAQSATGQLPTELTPNQKLFLLIGALVSEDGRTFTLSSGQYKQLCAAANPQDTSKFWLIRKELKELGVIDYSTGKSKSATTYTMMIERASAPAQGAYAQVLSSVENYRQQFLLHSANNGAAYSANNGAAYSADFIGNIVPNPYPSLNTLSLSPSTNAAEQAQALAAVDISTALTQGTPLPHHDTNHGLVENAAQRLSSKSNLLRFSGDITANEFITACYWLSAQTSGHIEISRAAKVIESELNSDEVLREVIDSNHELPQRKQRALEIISKLASKHAQVSKQHRRKQQW